MVSTFRTPAELRAFLQGQYGSSTSGDISPQARVETALQHEQPDRVPFDFWAVPEVCTMLRERLGVNSDEEVLQLLGVDCRLVEPTYVGPAPQLRPDGTYVDQWGMHRRRVANEFSIYDEYASYPLAEAQTVADVERWDGWPQPEHWDVSGLQEGIRAMQSGGPYHMRYQVGGIFEASWALRGLEQFLIDLVQQPEIPGAIMDCYTDLYIANVTNVLEAADGEIDMVYTYDDVGIQQGLMFSKAMWREHILPRHQRLNAAIRRFPVWIMYHSCGAVFPLIEAFARDMDIDVLNPLQPRAAGMDLTTIKEQYGTLLSFHGAVDIQHTLPHGSPAHVQAEVRDCCRILGRGGGYICASAHYIQADTPLENIIAMYTTPRQV